MSLLASKESGRIGRRQVEDSLKDKSLGESGSPFKEKRKKRKGYTGPDESVSTTQVIRDYIKQFDKTTPPKVLKEAYIAAKMKEGISKKEAENYFDSKSGDLEAMTDIYH